jgi:hypothetical protein
MTARHAIVAISLLAAPWLAAQKVAEEPQEDPVQAAIREFNRRDSKEPNEVTVVLPPPDEASAASKEDETSEASAEDAEPESSADEEPIEAAVLVTGKAPEDSELVEETEETSPDEEEVPEEPAPKPRTGLEVRVQKIQSGTGTIDPSQVKLLAPFPAKPLAEAPAGWHFEASEEAPPFTREVELSPGKHITLSIRPHLLVPDTNGVDVFTISEPGYEPSLGYSQNATVGAVLSQSIRQLDEDSKQLGGVIDNLQQLLVSLPKPEPAPEPKTGASPKRK